MIRLGGPLDREVGCGHDNVGAIGTAAGLFAVEAVAEDLKSYWHQSTEVDNVENYAPGLCAQK